MQRLQSRPHFHLLAAAAALVCAAASAPDHAGAQEALLLPGDARLDPEAIGEHTATHRFIQFAPDGAETEIGRLSRSVERVHHTADEPAILVSMQFRSPSRSGLDIVYLDAGTLANFVRYLTAPTGLSSMYQRDGDVHVTYQGRDGVRQTADTTVAHARFGGASGLVLAALEIGEGVAVRIPEINGGANTLAGAMRTNTVTFEGHETLELRGVWSGRVRRFQEERSNGTSVTYWIADEAPHLIRQDFHDAQGRRFLRWELVEHGPAPTR